MSFVRTPRRRNRAATRILTNSLAANDVAAVHGGYSRHRKDLLAGGVKTWELKPLPGMEDTGSLFGSSGASLHTEHSWRVSLDGGKLHWTDGNESFDHEPHASMGRRFQAWLARTLGLDTQL